ncbi:hypothetical protein YTPLAS18_08120 [Nitrospira sp.]|nr:hypothetical protein YTPLAS18_08120 [Nitrospira sp.]
MVRVARPPIPLLLCLIALLLAPACTSKPRAADSSGKGVTRTDEQIFLGDTIERNYDPHVIIKRAEAFFDREEFAEAVVELQHFLELHRAHRLAPYAQFRLGEAHLHQARTIDRDPEPVLKAESIFRKLRAEFPKSRYDEEALARIRECHEWLAKTHLFVGKFYFRRGAYLAAAHRYQAILQEYPDMEVAPEAQYQLARTYEAFGAEEWAREQLTILTQRYPNSSTEKDAQKLLTKLGGPLPSVHVADAAAPGATGPEGQRSSSGSLFASVPPSPAAPEDAARPNFARADISGRAPALVATPKFCRLGVWC